MVDATVLEAVGSNPVEVQVLSPAPNVVLKNPEIFLDFLFA